jgi:hypothetical protein
LLLARPVKIDDRPRLLEKAVKSLWISMRPTSGIETHSLYSIPPPSASKCSQRRRQHEHHGSASDLRWKVDRYLEQVGLKGEGTRCHSLRHSAVPSWTPWPRC